MRESAIAFARFGARKVSTRIQTGIFAIAICLEERSSLNKGGDDMRNWHKSTVCESREKDGWSNGYEARKKCRDGEQEG
jgi:hypothetical protein